MKKLVTKLAPSALSLGGAVVSFAQKTYAACGDPSGGLDAGLNCNTSPVTAQAGITQVINILLYIVGISSVIVIIVAGMLYVFSAGNPQSTSRAKDAILYAVIGVVVSILAYAIVNFVIKQF
ncbi:hypothetical protein KBC99_02145 [Candidatus Saccharibacteria bacterium]|nr:hypothetical protein [Candidatus Saccharibacteria bacterium]